jgi:hypothetical protein
LDIFKTALWYHAYEEGKKKLEILGEDEDDDE